MSNTSIQTSLVWVASTLVRAHSWRNAALTIKCRPIAKPCTGRNSIERTGAANLEQEVCQGKGGKKGLQNAG